MKLQKTSLGQQILPTESTKQFQGPRGHREWHMVLMDARQHLLTSVDQCWPLAKISKFWFFEFWRSKKVIFSGKSQISQQVLTNFKLCFRASKGPLWGSNVSESHLGDINFVDYIKNKKSRFFSKKMDFYQVNKRATIVDQWC